MNQFAEKYKGTLRERAIKRAKGEGTLKGAGKRSVANELKTKSDSKTQVAEQVGIPKYLRRDKKN